MTHPIREIEQMRQLYAAHSCSSCKRKDRQHWFYPRSLYRKNPLTWEFCNLQCEDWPNVEYVCWNWHHKIFNPLYDKPWMAPRMPSINVMRNAVRRHYNRQCSCKDVVEDALVA